ncbi:2Fe-2S iron-sulfur cluster-binding protein [Streptomyces sp. NBC_01314]|uniref:2Fe-2S iron-sulfur cluster-binding protein n=1 Tax=Streptomyces sp. NBC_01314 TaxID=2903821 RepID=UPI0030883908|nr:hybrid-cluster NAD(P)-dependent oxidoreductase [Streptomyces sp. NBC_01314]
MVAATGPDTVVTTGDLFATQADFSLMPPSWAPDCWGEEDQAVLVCRKVLEITHDVKSFHFEADGHRTFSFDPGQFVTLQLEIDGAAFTRCYTISSPPTRPHRISITVKRVPGGPVSNWLHDNVVPGTRITAQAPLGGFTPANPPAPKYLFLSAGSGITPLMSMTRTMYDLGSDADVLFVHSARTPADIIFRRELEAMTAVMPNIRVVHVCEDDNPSERWMGLRGRLSAPLLQALAPDLDERETYTCGPAGYMASIRGILGEVGYDMRRYHEESFSFESLPASSVPTPVDGGGAATPPDAVGADEGDHAPASDEETGAPTTYSVEFVRSGRTVTCAADGTLLDAAYAAGLRPPASCTAGMCGTCKTTMLSGEVDMQHNGGIRPREVAQNKILICCSKPLSDVRIDA